jgi:hypothetical protein
LEGLVSRPNVRHFRSALVRRFVSRSDVVEVHYLDLPSGEERCVRARRVILAAGALGTSRIALRSLDLTDRAVPVLSNAYSYIPCVNLAMLGRPAANRRHSLAQLTGVFSEGGPAADKSILSFFSYRSLLLFKLVKEMPMPPNLGLLTARLLLSSLTIVGVHHADRRAPGKTMRLRGEPGSTLEISYTVANEEQAVIDSARRKIRRALREMNCIPLGQIIPGNGSSIHYAGAFGITTDRADPLGTTAGGQLYGAPGVSIADSANWRFLPAKGLTMTLMANARRVASAVCDGL